MSAAAYKEFDNEMSIGWATPARAAGQRQQLESAWRALVQS
jgi:hypothetical protein